MSPDKKTTKKKVAKKASRKKVVTKAETASPKVAAKKKTQTRKKKTTKKVAPVENFDEIEDDDLDEDEVATLVQDDEEEDIQPDPEEEEPAAAQVVLTEEIINNILEAFKDRESITYGELNKILPEDIVTGKDIDAILSRLAKAGVELDDTDVIDDEDDDIIEEEDDDDDVVDDDDEDGLVSLDADSGDIHDPVRMYLSEMGSIPLLTREEEVTLAKQIEISCKRFRKRTLESPIAIRYVMELNRKVLQNRESLDKIMRTTNPAGLGKNDILSRLPGRPF